MTTKLVKLPKHIEAWGFIPHMLNPTSDKPLWEQIHDNYAHGGGWNDFDKFDLSQTDKGTYMLTYPGDPAYVERDRMRIGDEALVLFDHSWIMWIKGDEVKVARID